MDSNEPEWVLFIKSLDKEGNEEECKKFYEFLKTTKENCSYNCKEINGWFRCVNCHLKIGKDKDWEWIWFDPDIKYGRWLCISKDLYNKIVQDFTLKLVQNSNKFWITLKDYFFEKQKGICPECNKLKEFEEMDLHHIISRSNGGRETEENLILLCRICHHKHLRESLY
jgi:hypothetical protein